MKQFITPKEIKTIEIEASSNCQCACPMCSRNLSGDRLAPGMVEENIDYDDLINFLTPDFISHLKEVTFSGTFGDPLFHPRLYDICNHFLSINPDISIGVLTNSSLRTPKWWKEMGEMFKNTKSKVVFSVDGVSTEILHKYRRNAIWEKVYENMRAYCSTGARAQWDFLVFEHNKHQLGEVKRIAEELGMRLRVKKTHRFITPSLSVMPYRSVMDINGNEVDRIFPPKEENLRPTHLVKTVNTLKKKTDNISEYKNTLTYEDIVCKTFESKYVYIAASGLMRPCCWTSATTVDKMNADMAKHLLSDTAKRELSIKNNTLEEIFASDSFNEIFNRFNSGGFKVCAKNCSKAMPLRKNNNQSSDIY